MVGCRPRFGYEGEKLWNADDSEEDTDDPTDVNEAVMCLTRRQGGWRKWPRVNIVALKLKSEWEVMGEFENEGLLSKSKSTTPSTPSNLAQAGQVPKDASIFDVAPLVRFFQLSGTVSGRSFGVL